MIWKGSRYTKSQVIAPVDAEGRSHRVLALRKLPETQGVFEHIVVEGERLDQIANRYYGEPKKYWLILDANPDILHPFEILEVGRRIKIPKNRIVTE